MKSLQALRYVRLAPFDLQTDQGRRDERYRVAALSILANVLSRTVGVALTLLSVSLTLPYLGVERFGIWMTVASFAALLTFLDLGIGNALTNHVAERAAADDPDLLRRTISGGLGFLALIGLGMGVLLWLIAANLPWQKIIKVSEQGSIPEVRQTAMCFALLFGFTIFTSGVSRVYAGLQQAFKAHLVSTLTTLAACFVLWCAAETRQGIVVLLTIVLGAQIVAGFILLIMLATRQLFTLRDIGRLTRDESPHLFKVGGLFLLLQIGTMVGWGADSLIIASTLGAAHVAVFSVVQRLFQFATQPLGILNAPLWAAYADAHLRGDKEFICKTLKKSMLTTLASATFISLLLVYFHPWFIHKWTSDSISVPLAFVSVYAIWTIFDSCGNAFAMFLNGSGIIGLQVRSTIIFICVGLPLKVILVMSYGLTGLLIGTILSYLIAVVCFYGVLYRNYIFSNINKINDQ